MDKMCLAASLRLSVTQTGDHGDGRLGVERRSSVDDNFGGTGQNTKFPGNFLLAYHHTRWRAS
jgi:hypothetical protein